MKRCRLINLPYISVTTIFEVPNYGKHRINNRNCFLSKVPSDPQRPWCKISKSEMACKSCFQASRLTGLSNRSCHEKIQRIFKLSQSSHYSKGSSESNENDEDIRSISKMVEDTDIAVDSLGQKVSEVFKSAREKLDEVSALIGEETFAEIEETKKSINNMIKSSNGDKSELECLIKYKSDLERVRAGFTAACKHCGEDGSERVKKARSSQETRIEKARDFNMSIKKMFEDCEKDGKALRECLRSERIKILNRFTDLTRLLNRVPKDVEQNAADVFKEALKCHLRAQKKTVKDLRDILTDSARCFSKKTQIEEDESSKKICKLDEICVEEAREQVKIIFNHLRQDLLSCNKYLFQISKPDEDTINKQKLLAENQEILIHLRNVSRDCAQAVDPFSYSKEQISNLQTKLRALYDKVGTTFSHVPNVADKLYVFEGCCKRAVENAIVKLKNVERNANQCLSELRK